MNYSEIRPHLRTLDLLCWSGTGMFSRAIKAGQRDSGHPAPSYRISHVGVVVRGSDLCHSDKWRHLLPRFRDRVLTFESTTLNEVPDVVTGEELAGVSLVPLTEKVRAYDGQLWVRKWPTLPDNIVPAAFDWMEAHHGTPYEKRPAQLLLSALTATRGLFGEDPSTLFCSEAVTELLEYVGLMDERRQDSDAICPAEVFRFDTPEGLRTRVALGQPIAVQMGEARAA